jgi:hypothetical protein
MATTDFGKISLKPSTKMSLNDRFQLLRQTQIRRPQTNAININNNKTALQLRQGSQKNKRLALQMANRPSVIAALRTNSNQSIKQRLGNQRLNNNIVGNNRNFGQRNINARNRNQKRFINRSNFNTNVGLNRNLINRNQMRQQFQNQRNNSQNIGVVVGVRQTVRKGIYNQFIFLFRFEII